MATRVFFDDFESYSVGAMPFTNWYQDSGFRNPPQIVTSAIDGLTGPYSGTKMARCNHNNTVAFNAADRFETAALDTDVLYTDEIFIRVRVRVDTDVKDVIDEGQKILRFFFADATHYHDLFEVMGHPQDSFNNSAASSYTVTLPTYWGGASGDHTNEADSGWHKSEYYIKQSTGVVKCWHDGVLIRNDTGVDFEGVKWTPFYLCSNGDSGTDPTDHVYFDDFEIYSDLTTGEATTGSMSDASIQVGDDTTPPTLSSPSNGTETSDGTGGASVSTDEGNGTLYWAILTDGGSCTDAQLKAGSGGNIVAGKAGNQAVSSTGTQTIPTITGLSSSTNYEIVFLQADASANDSSQATVGLLTTAAGSTTLVLSATWGADVRSTGVKFPDDGADFCGGNGTVSLRVANKFNISSLPSNATVTLVELLIEVFSVASAGALLWDIDGYNGTGLGDPEADSGATMYSSCEITGVYVNDTTTFRTSGSKVIDLGAQARADVESARDAGTVFTVAIRETTDVASASRCDFAEYTDSPLEPRLRITYMAGGGALALFRA